MQNTVPRRRRCFLPTTALVALMAASVTVNAAHAVKPRVCPDGTVASDSQPCQKKFKTQSISSPDLEIVGLPRIRNARR